MQKASPVLKDRNYSFLLLVILTISIIAPLNNDIFISSIPAINKAFSIDHAQWILSIGLISIAFSQLFSGVLMDSFGRRPVILSGLLLFSISGIGIVFSDHFNLVLICRMFQSIGASCSIVGAVAIAKDSVPKEKLVYYTSFIFGIISISPLLAPVLGSYLQHIFDWKGSFSFLAAIGVFYLILMTIFFKESIVERDLVNIGNLIQAYWRFLKNREYVYYIIINCMSYIILFSLLATSSTIIIHKFGYSVIAFGYIFLSFSFMLFFMNVLVPKLSDKIGIRQITVIGVLIMLIGSILFLKANIFYSNLLCFLIPMLTIGIGCGIIRPSASSAVMQLFPAKVAGKTIALYSFAFYITSGIATIFSYPSKKPSDSWQTFRMNQV